LDQGAGLQTHALEIVVKIGFPFITAFGASVLLVSQMRLHALTHVFGRQAEHYVRLCSGEVEKTANVTIEQFCKGEDSAGLFAEFLKLAFRYFNNPARVG
jgi:hypothetical protein